MSLGYAWADPVIGLAIAAVLLKIVWESGQTILGRLLDGVEPEVLDSLHHALSHVPELETDIEAEAFAERGVSRIANLRVRWLGHRLHVEMDMLLPPNLSFQATREITNTVEQQLKAHVPYLGLTVVRAVPSTGEESGEQGEEN